MRKVSDFQFYATWILAIFLGLAITLLPKAVRGQNLPASGVLNGYAGNMIPNLVATIPAAGTTTPAINLKGFTLTGILLPATFTSTTLTFKVSVDGTNFFVLKSTTSGSSLSYTVAQGTYAAIDPVAFYGVQYLEIVSGSTEGSARNLTLAVKGI